MMLSLQARPSAWLLSFLAFACAALPAQADDEDMFLGVAHYHRVGPYRTSATNSLEPTGDYEGKRFIIRGDTVGMRLWRQGSLSFDLIAQNDLLAFRAADAQTAALRALHNRQEGLNGGLELAWTPTADDAVHLATTYDLLGQSKSAQTSVEYDHTFALPVSYTQIIPNVAYTRYASRYSRYYFGISADDKQRTSLSTFTPGAIGRFDAGLTIVQPFSKDVAMFVDYTHKRYGSGIAASPMLARSSYFEANVGLVYNFKGLF